MKPARRVFAHLAAVAIVCVSSAACSRAGDDASAEPLPSTASRSFEEVPAESSSTGQVPEGLLADLIADAASGAGIDPSEVEVVEAEAVTWNDGSLGCPEPGMSYTQALVPGYRVVIEIEGELLHFHSDSSGSFRLCEDPDPGGAGGA